MPVINVVKVSTFLQSAGPAPVNYLPISAILVEQGDAPFVAAAKLYSSGTEMLDDGWLSTDNGYLHAVQVLGQGAFTNTPCTRVAIVHESSRVAQVSEFTITDTDDGTYELYIALVGGSAVLAATFAAVGSTVTQIKDGLITSFNLGAFAATHTAATVDANTGTVTGDVLGVPFVLSATVPAGATATTITVVTPAVGPYDSLDAAWQVVKFWGVIPLADETEGIMTESSRWAEASAEAFSVRRNVALLQTTDADILSATEPNFASTLVGLARTRSFPLYHINGTDPMTAAWFGRYGGQFPGSRAWHFAQQGGTSLTSTINWNKTQVDNVLAQRASIVERDGPSAVDTLRVYWGMGAGGFLMQHKQAEDYWWLRTNQALATAMGSPDGVTLDDPGIAKLVAAVDAVNTELGTSDPPVLDLARTTVTPVPLADVPDAELAVGDYQTTGGIFVDTVLIPRALKVAASATFALV
jgi:hypothetical protein